MNSSLALFNMESVLHTWSEKTKILNEMGATADSGILLPREINLIAMLYLMFITIIGQHFQFSHW